MNTDILEYTLAKFRETNDFDKHFDRIAFHQYCIDQATSNKDIEEVNKFKYVFYILGAVYLNCPIQLVLFHKLFNLKSN